MYDHIVSAEIMNIPLKFETTPTLFSPNSIDKGTLAMLSIIDFSKETKVLDLGCGYGVVGILVAKLIGKEKVIMCDVSQTAVEFARANAVRNQVSEIDIRLSDGFENIPEKDVTMILSNPPYHTDFSVAKHFIEMGYKKLVIGGRMVMVTKRLEWYKNKLASVFGGVKVYEVGGYYVFVAEKRQRAVRKMKKAKKHSKKLQRKYGSTSQK